MAQDKPTTPMKKARVEITIKDFLPAEAEPSLPFKTVMLGDYTGKQDGRDLAERERVAVNKENFNDVMKKFDLGVDVSVPDRIGDQPGQEAAVSLKFRALADFRPEAIAEQVPALKKLLEVRRALKTLQGPLSNMKPVIKRINEICGDGDLTQKIATSLESKE